MMLDLTAGNRTMWTCKDSPYVVFLDVEAELAVPPTVIADSRYLPFRSEVFDIVFFDPPHAWGKRKWQGYHCSPRDAYGRHVTAYYGWDKYPTRGALLRYVYDTAREAARVTKPDAALWFKWCDLNSPLEAVLPLLVGWRPLLRIRSSDERKLSRAETWWVMLGKDGGGGA